MKKVKPQIAKRVALDEIGLSHRKLEQGQVRGTVVCLPWKRVSRRNIHQLDENKDAGKKKNKKKEKKESKKKDSETKDEANKDSAKQEATNKK